VREITAKGRKGTATRTLILSEESLREKKVEKICESGKTKIKK
jgi:hypothetical protein